MSPYTEALYGILPTDWWLVPSQGAFFDPMHRF